MAGKLDQLQAQINYQFADPSLAELALTHRSASQVNNERLEFLGDALLDLLVGEMLYTRDPEASEGELSRQRAAMVNKSALASLGRALHLGDLVQLGSGEARSGGKQRESILADTLEALVAAVYLDGGLEPCQRLVQHLMTELADSRHALVSSKDFKTRLQELMQAQGESLPQYLVVDTAGEAHAQTFFVECSVPPLAEVTRGSGPSKRVAEQEAARHALESLGAL